MKSTLTILIAVAMTVALFCAPPVYADGETASFTILHELDGFGLDGWAGVRDLVLVGDTLYGMTETGGQYRNDYYSGGGSIFSVKTDGTGWTVMHEHSGIMDDGYQAYFSSITANSSGTVLYGVTSAGAAGSNYPPGGFYGFPAAGHGNIFSISTSLNPETNTYDYTTLHTFPTQDGGQAPTGRPLLIGDTLYGMTRTGGTDSSRAGTIYSMKTTPDPENEENPYNYTILKNFSYGYPSYSGAGDPYGNSLVPNSSGTILYGMTQGGGNYDGDGVIFSITPSGAYTPLHTFTYDVDGAWPYGSLLLVGDTLYGMASDGGGPWNEDWSGPAGSIFSLKTTADPLNPENPYNFTVLHRFTYTPDGEAFDGATPEGDLVLVGDRLWGTTEDYGGPDGYQYGTIFSMKLDGSDFRTEWVFTRDDTNGKNPSGSLTYQPGSDPIFYLYTTGGGSNYVGGGGVVGKFQSGPMGPDPLVPEPATIISALLGLAGFAVRKIRR